MPLFHVSQVFLIFGFVTEELINIFNSTNVELFFGCLGKVEVIDLARPDGLVK